MDCIENGFQKTFFLGQAQEIILNFFRPNAPESLDQFLKKTGLHDFVPVKWLNVESLKRRSFYRFSSENFRELAIQPIQPFPARTALRQSAFPRVDNSVPPAPGSSQGCP